MDTAALPIADRFTMLVNELLALSDLDFADCRPDLLAACAARVRTRPRPQPGAVPPPQP